MQERGPYAPLGVRGRLVGKLALSEGAGISARKPWVRHLVGLLIAALWVAADQATKTWAENTLAGHPDFLFGHFGFELIYNSGIAFGIASGAPGIITVFGIVVSAVLVVVLFRTRRPLTTVAAALVLGGALGNVVDRIFRHNGGAVIDFLHSGFWPTFNLADAGVVIGLVLAIIATPKSEGAR